MIEVTGLKDVMKSLNNFVYDMDKAVDDAVRVTAFNVQRDAISSIKETSPGKSVKRGNVTHIQSKKGDAPNTDTGRLIGSIDVSHTRGDLFAHVYTNLDYGFFLETVNQRPWLEPAKLREKDNFSDYLTRTLKEQIEAAGK